MKKLLTITISALLMGLSCMAYAETNDQSALAIVKYNDKGMREDPVFQLMRKNLLLHAMSDSKRDVGNKKKKMVANLPFHNLCGKLAKKSSQLSDKETKHLDKNLEQLFFQTLKEDLSEQDNKFNALYKALVNFSKDYPAFAENVELLFAPIYDSIAILEDILEVKIDDLLNFDSDSVRAKSGLSENEIEELMDQVFNNEIEEYNKFVEENKDFLEKVSIFVDNGFKIKTSTKKCRTIKKKEYCTSGETESEIKALAEIMPYIMNSKETPALEAKDL